MLRLMAPFADWLQVFIDFAAKAPIIFVMEMQPYSIVDAMLRCGHPAALANFSGIALPIRFPKAPPFRRRHVVPIIHAAIGIAPIFAHCASRLILTSAFLPARFPNQT